jgi:hypothetical protein
VTSSRWPRQWKSRLDEILGDMGDQFRRDSALDRFVQETAARTEEDTWRRRPSRRLKNKDGMTSVLGDIVFQNCGLCLIRKLRDIGVSVIKLPTRGSPWLKTRLLGLARAVTRHPDPDSEFCRSLIDSPDFCEETGHCYYSTAMLGENSAP